MYSWRGISVKKTWLALVFILLYITVVASLFHIPFFDKLFQVFLFRNVFNGLPSGLSTMFFLLFPILAGGVIAWVFGKYEQSK